MKFIKSLLFLLVLAIPFSSHATQKKAQLQRICSAQTCFYQYTSTTYLNILSADTMSFFVDTTNLYGIDPDVWLVDIVTGDRTSTRTYPGRITPKSLCVTMLAAGDVDSSTTRIDAYWSPSKTDTMWASAKDTASFQNTGHTKTRFQMSVKYEPNRWFGPKLLTTSATDTTFLKSLVIFPCQN